MHGIKSRNVCAALPHGVKILTEAGAREETRAGFCLVTPGPVITITDRPTERVLFSAARDANPFFHLVEALWMLSGSNDVSSLTRYVRDFGERFAEPGDGGNLRMHGAYGHRWRHALGYDQLDFVVTKLRQDPTSRQCVIQMWDARKETHNHDWLQGSEDLTGDWKDRPCNTHIYLRVREDLLDLTVLCRSNDNVWGAHGANAVHFSVLLEYLAARMGFGIGKMYQFSNNYHAYEETLDRLRKRAGGGDLAMELVDDRYEQGLVVPLKMFDEPDKIYEDLSVFFGWHDGDLARNGADVEYGNSWFARTAEMMVLAHRDFKAGNFENALKFAGQIQASDWRVACTEWIKRRAK